MSFSHILVFNKIITSTSFQGVKFVDVCRIDDFGRDLWDHIVKPASSSSLIGYGGIRQGGRNGLKKMQY